MFEYFCQAPKTQSGIIEAKYPTCFLIARFKLTMLKIFNTLKYIWRSLKIMKKFNFEKSLDFHTIVKRFLLLFMVMNKLKIFKDFFQILHLFGFKLEAINLSSSTLPSEHCSRTRALASVFPRRD